jgi:tmRNA-binding protein
VPVRCGLLLKTSGVFSMNKKEEFFLLNRAISDLRVELDKEISKNPLDSNRLIILSRKLDILIAGYYQKKYRKVI